MVRQVHTPKSADVHRIDAHRIDAIIHSRHTNWADCPPELVAVISKTKERLSEWSKRKTVKSVKSHKSTLTEFSTELFSDLFGELRAAESRKRILQLKLDINKLRETRCKYLISLQANAVDAVRLKKLLQASPDEHEKPLPRLCTNSEKQRVEEILHYDFEMLFGRQN